MVRLLRQMVSFWLEFSSNVCSVLKFDQCEVVQKLLIKFEFSNRSVWKIQLVRHGILRYFETLLTFVRYSEMEIQFSDTIHRIHLAFDIFWSFNELCNSIILVLCIHGSNIQRVFEQLLFHAQRNAHFGVVFNLHLAPEKIR